MKLWLPPRFPQFVENLESRLVRLNKLLCIDKPISLELSDINLPQQWWGAKLYIQMLALICNKKIINRMLTILWNTNSIFHFLHFRKQNHQNPSLRKCQVWLGSGTLTGTKNYLLYVTALDILKDNIMVQ